jgi:hypothetical protein
MQEVIYVAGQGLRDLLAYNPVENHLVRLQPLFPNELEKLDKGLVSADNHLFLLVNGMAIMMDE